MHERWSSSRLRAALLVTVVIVAITSIAGAALSAPDPRFSSLGLAASPDGTKVAYPVPAYTAQGDPATEFCVSDLNGASRRKVAVVPGLWSIRWAGPGTLAGSYLEERRVALVSTSTGKVRYVSLGSDLRWPQTAIARNGKTAAFSGFIDSSGKPIIATVDLSSGRVKTLAKDIVQSWVTWSPDSRRIAYGVGSYQKDYQLKIVDVAGGDVTDLGLKGVGVSWSPDGQWIAYSGQIVRGGNWYGGVPVDGSIVKTNVVSRKTVVLTEPPVNAMDQQKQLWDVSGSFDPSWSPDGRSISYRRVHRKSEGTREIANSDELWVMKSDGSSRRRVSAKWGSNAWAGDGRSIVVKGDSSLTRIWIDTGRKLTIASWKTPEPPALKPSDWKSMKMAGATIEYAGIDAAYAKALMRIAAAARDAYVRLLGADVPETVGLKVTKEPMARASLFTDGQSRMFLTVGSVEQLAPPARSGVFQIYGVCHELGHMAMYRRIRMIGLPQGVGEGWAHYAGSVVTDEVYKALGKDVWPIPYDYSADGLPRLKSQVEAPGAQDQPDGRAAAAFYTAHLKHGAAKLFAAMNEASIEKPYGKDVMPRFVDALVRQTGDESVRQLFGPELLKPTVEWRTAEREITEKTVEGVVTTDDDTGVLLSYDDGKSDGKISTSGSGHASAFRRPAGDWSLDGVMIYGSRYGTPDAPKEDFSIYVLDTEFNVLAEVRKPYSGLGNYEEKWYRFDFEPVKLPEAFYVCVYFDPTASKGFYMNYDKSVKKSHSRSALPWSHVMDATDRSDGKPVDWMLRIHLRKR